MDGVPAPEWGRSLQEPKWPLEVGGEVESYPERSGEPDCLYYLRTGHCGYGSRCRYNHPRDRSMAMGALRAAGSEYPERSGQPVCQYYMRTGMCKFGVSCKYHHPKPGVGSSSPLALNFYGYPLRPGEKECSYYVKTGQCRFGATCKFHHPQPAGVPPPSVYPTMQHPSVQSSQHYGVIQGNWPVPRPPSSYMPGNYSPLLLPQRVIPFPGWTPYQPPVSPVASPSSQAPVGAAPIYGIQTGYTGPYISFSSSGGPSSSSHKEHAFPERPGQPECQYYLRTGDCKFGSACKYHHPPDLTVLKSNFVLSPMGLPLRPGTPLCAHYAQNGVCKFGPSCKFDHPMRSLSYSTSTSSLTDMPVAPYPVGSTNATLAPSSSSSDLRPDLLSGFGKDALSSQMSSMSSSVGSIFSRGSVVPQQPGQSSTSSTGDSSIAQVTSS